MKHHRPKPLHKRRRHADEAHAPADAHEAPPTVDVALLRNAGAPEAQRAAAIAAMQRAAGNTAVEGALAQRMGAPAERELPALQEIGAAEVHLAGVAVPQAPPTGLGAVSARGNEVTGGFGMAAGWTGVKSVDAFTAPAFRATDVPIRKGNTTDFYVDVQPTSAQDATHESFYVAPGLHLLARAGSATQVIDGKTYTHYALVSPEMSALIREGEQEHLSDALQAYILTYDLVAKKINELARRRIGPARDPQQAMDMARDALSRLLPAPLGSEPLGWYTMLRQLLRVTKERDNQGWHSFGFGPSRRRGNKIIWPFVRGRTSKIGEVASEDLVKYP